MCIRSAAFAVILLLASAQEAGGQVPSTDVFVMEMPEEPFMGPPAVTNLTDRDGYDNQPRFSDDGRYVYFTSIWEDGQADVYRIDLQADIHRRVTFSTESEYSPTPEDAYLDVVRVEADGRQRLWRFDPAERAFSVVFPDLEPVGYFGWIDERRLAAFVLGEPHRLVLATRGSNRLDTLASDIGRTIEVVPGRDAVSFIQKNGGDAWSIDMIDFESGSSGTITPTLPGREDFAWTPDGRLLMADGQVIYMWTSGTGTWERFADFSSREDIGAITRIAVSPRGDLIAFVAERND
jgi:hypothetical protein